MPTIDRPNLECLPQEAEPSFPIPCQLRVVLPLGAAVLFGCTTLACGSDTRDVGEIAENSLDSEGADAGVSDDDADDEGTEDDDDPAEDDEAEDDEEGDAGAAEADDGPLLYGGSSLLAPIEGRIVRCDEARGGAEDPTIDDMEDEDLETLDQDGRRGTWYSYGDSSADSSHELEIEAVDDGASGSDFALRTQGEGFTRWGAGVGFLLIEGVEDEEGEPVQCSYDASYYDGLRFYAKGNDVEVRVKLAVPDVLPIDDGGFCAESCYDDHGVDLTFSEEWEEYEVPFSALEQQGWGFDAGPFDPSAVRFIQFQVQRNVDFDFWIDELEFFTR